MLILFDDGKKTTAQSFAITSKALDNFLDTLEVAIESDAPDLWSSDDATEKDTEYNFRASEQYVHDNFPLGCDKKDFKGRVIAKAQYLFKSGYTPAPAHAGWMLGMLANFLSKANQEGVILDDIVPNLLEKCEGLSVGTYLNPAILNALQAGPAQTAFLSHIVGLISDSVHDKMSICGFNNLLSAHIGRSDRSDALAFENEKTEIANALLEAMGTRELVKWCSHDGNIKLKMTSLEGLLGRLNPDKARDVAIEITEQVSPSVLARNLDEVFSQKVDVSGSFSRSGMRFFSKFMKALPEDKRLEYGSAILEWFGPKGMVTAINQDLSSSGFNKQIRGFIDAFPVSQAEEIVTILTNTALSHDYAVSPNEYNENINKHWGRAEFATQIHDVIPEKYHALYEKRIMDYLNHPDRPDYALITASILLRSMITQDGKPHSTQEIDFYPIPMIHSSRAIAHIKPKSGQNYPGIVTTGDFVGTLSEYFDVLTNHPDGGPRFHPPNKKAIFPPDKHLKLHRSLEKVENLAVQNVDGALPTLQAFLQSRQPIAQLTMQP